MSWKEFLGNKEGEVKMPTLTITILSICIVAFIIESIIPAIEYLAFTPAHAITMPWTFITSIFLHTGLDHLLGNMIFLTVFGILLESRINRKKFLLVFLLSGIAGNISYMLTTFNPEIPAIGLMGAIYGLAGCLIVILPLNFSISTVIVWVLTGYLVMGDLPGLFYPLMFAWVSAWSHLVGLLVGIVFGLYFKFANADKTETL